MTPCSCGSWAKNTGVVCHSLLLWTTCCQNSPLWPAHLGWPCLAHSSTELHKPLGHDKTVIHEGARTLTPSKRSCSFGFFFFLILDFDYMSQIRVSQPPHYWHLRPSVHWWGVVLVLYDVYSILDLTPQDASSPLSPAHFLLAPTPQICSHLAVTTTHVSRQYHYIPWQETQPWLKVTVLACSVWCSVMEKWGEMEDWDWHIYTTMCKT